MANKKLQYPSVSRVIKIPTAPPVTPPGGYFSKFEPVLRPKFNQLNSFNPVIRVPTADPVIDVNFIDWETAPGIKLPQEGFVTSTNSLGPAQTPPWFVFTQFAEPSKLKSNQQIDNSSSFFTPTVVTPSANPKWIDYIYRKPPQEGFITSTTLPIVAVVQPYVFSPFEQPRFRPIQIDDSGNDISSPPAVTLTPAIFTGFLDYAQPNPNKYIIIDDQANGPSITPAPPVFSDSVAFSGFPFAVRKKLFYQAGSFVPPVPPVFVQPYVFSSFEQPRFYKPTAFQDVSNVNQIPAVVTTQVWIFSSFDQIQLSSRIFHQADSFVLPQQQAVVVQPYIFSSFEQPQFKKLFLDTPTQFTTVQAPQPYIFSRFEQPQFRKLFLDTGVQFQSLTIANPIPPVFTGFNDFGLAQQLIGSQRKQDGAYVDFRILQPIFIPSVVQFGGWYDFGLRPASTSFRAEQQPQVIYEVLVPPIPLESAFAGKRWKYQETEKTPEIKNKVLPLKSSNLAAMSYDEDKKELRLTFKTYKYENVSKKKVQNLSHGEYFQKHIKAKHPTAKV